jgi:LppX_LprAFG lipoprotein
VLLLVPVALVAAGCSDTVSLDPVAKAAEASAKQSSEHMTMEATFTSGLETVTMRGSGDFQNDPLRADLIFSAGDGAQTVDMHELMAGTTVYVRSNALAGRLPGGKSWLRVDVGNAMKSLGVDLGSLTSQTPADAFARLKAAGTVTKVGGGTIGGTAVTHYSVVLDLGQVTKLTKRLHADVSYAPVDVWVDAGGLVRRMHVAAVYGGSGSATLPQSALDMTMTLSDYGEPVAVTLPTDAETFDASGVVDGLLRK